MSFQIAQASGNGFPLCKSPHTGLKGIEGDSTAVALVRAVKSLIKPLPFGTLPPYAVGGKNNGGISP